MSGEEKKRPPPIHHNDDEIVIEAPHDTSKEDIVKEIQKSACRAPGAICLQARSRNSWSL
jgi:hypothetical protein